MGKLRNYEVWYLNTETGTETFAGYNAAMRPEDVQEHENDMIGKKRLIKVYKPEPVEFKQQF